MWSSQAPSPARDRRWDEGGFPAWQFATGSGRALPLLLLELNFFGRATGLVGEAPRDIKFGPCSGWMHPVDAFGARLAISRRFFKDVAAADRAADSAMTREAGPGSAGAATIPASPDRGFYADPAGQRGVRYWDGREWSPLLPAGIADDRVVGKFPGPVLSPLPEPDGSWQFAAAQARRSKNRAAGFAAAAAVAVAAWLSVHLGWLLYFAALFAFRILSEWWAWKKWRKLDQVARGSPVPVADAASRASQAEVLFAVLLSAGAITLAGCLVLFNWGTHHHNNYTWSGLTFSVALILLSLAGAAWVRRKNFRKIDQANAAAAVLAGTGDGAARSRAAQMRCLECGAESAEAAEACARCGAPVGLEQPLAATPAAGGSGSSIAPVAVDTPDGPPAQRTRPGTSRRKALVVGGAGAVMAVAVLVAGLAVTSSPTSTNQLTADQLQPGDCLTGSNMVLVGGGTWPDYVTQVACTKRHEAEVFFAANIWPQSLAFPGQDAIDNQSDARCGAVFAAYDGINQSQSTFTFTDIVDDDSSDWASGARSLICIAYEPSPSDPSGGTPVNYSIKGSDK